MNWSWVAMIQGYAKYPPKNRTTCCSIPAIKNILTQNVKFSEEEKPYPVKMVFHEVPEAELEYSNIVMGVDMRGLLTTGIHHYAEPHHV